MACENNLHGALSKQNSSVKFGTRNAPVLAFSFDRLEGNKVLQKLNRGLIRRTKRYLTLDLHTKTTSVTGLKNTHNCVITSVTCRTAVLMQKTFVDQMT